MCFMQSTKNYMHIGLRWFGKEDPLTLQNLKQAGADYIISALHEVPVGAVWETEKIKQYQRLIDQSDLSWTVVESLPVHESIKYQGKDFKLYIEYYKQSIVNLAQCGIKTITYNFMPVLDWVRTDHKCLNEDGTSTLFFDPVAMAYFDCYILERTHAKSSYTKKQIEKIEAFASQITEEEEQQLTANILLGLPGSNEDFSIAQLEDRMRPYKALSAAMLRQNLIYFLQQIIPVAQKHGVHLAIHPDDPPFPVLGLPRIVSTAQDLDYLFRAVPAVQNGLCFCSGSLGANGHNDLNEILITHQERIHFLHLRDVRCFADGSFQEAPHLTGDHDMRTLMQTAMTIAKARKIELPVRPDHGFLHTFEQHKKFYPGYSLLGRMQGLAALKGLAMGLA